MLVWLQTGTLRALHSNMRPWLGAWLLFLPATVFGGVDGETIEIGVRAQGLHTNRDLALERARLIRLDDLPLARSVRFDAQAQEERSYLGVDLGALIARHPEAAKNDLALLHFANGMIVPVALAFGKPQLEVFVARAAPSFPEVMRKKVLAPDRRPISFGANKIVVADLTHPLAPDPVASSFSPWSHVDTLIAIELVQREAWDRQFDAGPGDVARGRAVFLARCQYCHAVREVGAKYGWDFIEPTPLFEYRTPNSLYPHVRFINTIAADDGAMMPPQKDVALNELEDLWSWMKAIWESGPNAYGMK